MATMSLIDDGVQQYAHEEKWESGAEIDSHLVLRETPRWKVRDEWAKIAIFKHNMALQHELHLAHQNEFFDAEVAPLPKRPERTGIMGRIENAIETFGVWFCHSFHRMPEYNRGDLYWTCVCGRKYAVPFADPNKIPYGVYVQAPFKMPAERTMQAEVRGAHARLINGN